MAVLSVENLTKSFGARTLFSNVSFTVEPNEKIGLIGVNGSGKTTLLRILLGMEPYDGGNFGFRSGSRIAYVEQQPVLSEQLSLYDFTLEAFRPLIDMEAELASLEKILSSGDVHDRDRRILRQSVLLEQFEREGGLTYRAVTRSALMGMGFSEDELNRSVLRFSGGQISKAMLLRAVLQKADLLFLDEPTNNLDVAAIRWLEEYLKQYKAAVLIISHDRAFLDATVTKMLELTMERMHSYDGNFTAYQEQKLSDRQRAEKLYLRQQKEIKRIEGIIAQQKRWNQAHNYVTIASKQKQIDRIRSQMTEPEKAEQGIRFRFPTPTETGFDVLRLTGLGKSYGDHLLFSDVDLLIRKQETVCLVGANGCGKTTLLRILRGEELPDCGSVRLGAGVRLGYYSQHTRDLNENRSIIDELDASFPAIERNTLRGYLGMFLFRDDDIHKVIGTLSGGEKARIQLLKLVLSGANVLLLDEPTNHLDILSCEVLESALERFEGTVLIVTHDRYLVRRLADRVLLLEQNGIYEPQDEQEDVFLRIHPPVAARTVQKSVAENHYRRQKERKAERTALRQRINATEREIERIEAELMNAQGLLEQLQSKGDYSGMQRICDALAEWNEAEERLFLELSDLEEQWSNMEETE